MQESSELRALEFTVLLYVLVFALKFGAYLLTNVMALLAEALHTLSDIFISGFLLAATVYSRREADETHMFGYGRAQNVAALVAATLFISFTSYKLYEESIPRLLWPEAPSYQNLSLAIAVLVISMFLAFAPLISLARQKARGAAAKAQLAELINDELGLVAALAGTILILRGEPIADPIASIVVATIIAVNAIGLFRQNASFLMGRSPGPEFFEKVMRMARSVNGVLDVHDLRAEYVGPETVHLQMHVRVRRGLPIEEAHRIGEEVRQRVHETTHGGYCVIHLDSA